MKAISVSDLCEKFFKPEPVLFMLSLVIFPKQHEGCVSQPKVCKQTNIRLQLSRFFDTRSESANPGIKCGLFLMTPRASVIPDFVHISHGKNPVLCIHIYTSKHYFHVCFE